MPNFTNRFTDVSLLMLFPVWSYSQLRQIAVFWYIYEKQFIPKLTNEHKELNGSLIMFDIITIIISLVVIIQTEGLGAWKTCEQNTKIENRSIWSWEWVPIVFVQSVSCLNRLWKYTWGFIFDMWQFKYVENCDEKEMTIHWIESK